MKNRLKIEEIQKIANNIVNILMSESDVPGVRGMLVAPLPSAMHTASTGTTPGKVGVAATKEGETKQTASGTAAKASTGKKVSSISTSSQIPKLSVVPNKNPLGIYANESIKDKGTEETEDLSDSIEREKKEKKFPVNLQ